MYNSATHPIKGITVGNWCETSHKATEEISLNSIMWKPDVNITKYQQWYYVNAMFLHLIPGPLIDALLKRSGKKPLYHLRTYLYIVDYAVCTSCRYHIISHVVTERLCLVKGEDWTSYFISTGIILFFLP